MTTKSRGKLTSEVCVSDAVLRWGLPRRQRNARLGLMFEVAHGRGRGESRRSQRCWETALTGTHGFPGGTLGSTSGLGRPSAGRSEADSGAARPADG